MAKYSDWRSDLREVMDDKEDEKKVTGKGVNNNKLIKINPKLGEAVEQIGGQILEVTEVDTVDGEEEEDKSKKFEKEKQDKIADKNKKKEMMLKKRIVRMKMMAVNQGAGDSLVAHHEPEGELVEQGIEDILARLEKGRISKGGDPDESPLGKKVGRAMKDQQDKARKKAGVKTEEVQNLDETLPLRSRITSVSKADMAKMALDDHKRALQKRVDQSTKNRGDLKKRDAGAMARDKMREKDSWYRREEVELDERLGGKGYSRSAMKSSIHPPSRQSSGDWEDSDRGAGNKAARRSGKKVEKKSPTYRAYVRNKEVSEGKIADALKKTIADMKAADRKAGLLPGGKDVVDLDVERERRRKKRVDEGKLDSIKATTYGMPHKEREELINKERKRLGLKPKPEKKIEEGVMKFIKDRVGGKKKPEKKASMDKTTEKLHTWRKSTSDKQKEHEKYVNFLPVDEEVVTELNRYGKETGKATGSLNKRPGSPVATRNQPNSAVNIVRRNVIRPQTGRPEGQQKKVKGEKGRVQPGDRKFTPAQTISRMRAQVAAADAAMRDTRGT